MHNSKCQSDIAEIIIIISSCLIGFGVLLFILSCAPDQKSEKELNAHTYDVIAISSFTDTETNLYGGVIRQDQGYIVSYIDYNGEINMWELVPDDSHKIKISSDGTNTITITTAGFFNR